ncbi:MAG: glutathione S-transferase family protein [Hyphomicrobium sp.]
MRLVIANKLYSSWSLRPWLVLRAFGIPFDEQVIPLRRAETKEHIARVSPSGKLPVLIDGDVQVWESLAIIEYLAEAFPDKAIWPIDKAARAHARSVANEMHGGFLPLRQALPMNLAKHFKTPSLSDDAKANVARIEQLWRKTAAEFGADGDYLFGAFSAADAMFAPIVTRLDTYQIPVDADTRGYMNHVLAHLAFVAWKRDALTEPWTISDYEAGHLPA